MKVKAQRVFSYMVELSEEEARLLNLARESIGGPHNGRLYMEFRQSDAEEQAKVRDLIRGLGRELAHATPEGE